MAPLVLPELFLCADGGGTSVTVAILSSTGLLARGQAGPCNVKTVGAAGAIDAILRATYQALDSLDPSIVGNVAQAGENGVRPLKFRHRIFKKVWLGLAGIGHQADVDAFAPHALEALCLEPEDNALRITNDGHLLASPCALLPDVDTAVVLVAGTGTVGSAFRKTESKGLECVGVTGGWGYLLGDEGSAYSIARRAMQQLLTDDDGRTTARLSHSSTSYPQSSLLPFYVDLLSYFGVPDCPALIDKTYGDHSTPSSRTVEAAEANRKVWIAEAARVVFAYAFDATVDEPSRAAALEIVSKAIQPLVQMAVRLVGDGSIVKPDRTALSLGGGLWKVKGYQEMLLAGLEARGIRFASVVVVNDAAWEGVRSLAAQ